MEGIRGEVVKLAERPSIFDITLYLWENGDIIEGEIEYNKDILKPDTISRLKKHFITLLDLMSSEIDATVNSISLICNEELKMIEEVNNTFKSFNNEKTIIQLFENQVMSNPGSIAIEFDDGRLTYDELNVKANHLAGVLMTYNINPGDFIGLLLKRSPELIVTLLALFKIRAAYVPLNLNDPESRIISILNTAKIKYIITNSDHELVLPDSYKRLNIEHLSVQNEGIHFVNEDINYTSTDSAYIIFTSGTTGTPKGVWVNHKSVINLIEWVNDTFKISQKDKLLWVTNLSFDLSVYDIFGILIAGGIVRILSDEDRLDPGKQYEIILSEGITFWDSAPQSLQQISQYFEGSDHNPALNTLRLVFLSGDWIPLSLPPAITSHFPSAVVIGLGGATEATIWSNFFIIGDIHPEWKSIPYGKPIQNAIYYILDDNLNHCRIKHSGNLYIGGECIALGYYNDPELTNLKFVPDPFNPGSKLYLTGDKAQWMNDGNIEFLGRDDEQVKIRGYRVELGEIKNVVIQNKVIKDAIVIPDRSDRHDTKVILFFTTYNEIKLDIKDLRRELRLSLPEYMIPTEIIYFKEFPITSNGKTDTKALFANYINLLSENKLENLSVSENLNERVKSFTPTQLAIYKIWFDLLKTDDISLDDNFFELGGYSLLVIRLINKINEELGISLTFRDFIMNSTINSLCVLIENRTREIEDAIKLVHLSETTNLPLTLNQKRIWLITKLEPNLPSYIIRFSYKFNGTLDRDVFENSLNLLFQRHHIVFSVIRELDGEPYCDILPTSVKLTYIDYRGVPEGEKKGKVEEIINTDSGTAFDLEQGPLYRLYLIRTSDNEHYFHMSIHHIIFDGWSQGVMIKDLNGIYNSLLGGREIDLPKLEYQQYDYAQWENSLVNTDNDDESIEFWKENLNGCSPVLNFPYDFQRRERPSGRGSVEPLHLSKDQSAQLRKISKMEDSSLFSTMLSVFGVQMQKYSGEDDINIGLPVVYRPHSKLENIFGMFVNTVVVRLRNEPGLTFRDIIKQTNETTLNAIAHQDLPFEKVVELVNPERSSGANPLFQVAFAWQNNLNVPLSLDGISSEKIAGKERAPIFDLTFYLWENGDVIEGEIEYNLDILKPETIKLLKDHFLILVNNLVEKLDIPVSSVPMISEEEKKMIDLVNDTFTNYPKDKTIAQIFEDQVNLFPDKKAVVFKGNSLTYRQLDERANQLARTLRDLGVKDNVSVGILVEKSLNMIVGILGILKAGGGYVPLDPEYPQQRITFIINDAGCKILLTQDKYLSIPIDGVSKINLDSKDSYHNDKSNIKSTNSSSDLAYIMYTSGTTGIPKGSMILQFSVIRLVRNTNYIKLSSSDKILLTGAIAFDATTFEIWGALLNGGALFIAEKETILDPKVLRKELDINDITILWLTSPLFTQLAESSSTLFNKLNYLLVGGDVLSVPHINKVRNDNPKLKVINGYGPTENTTFSTTFLIDSDFVHNIPIGKPISNSTAFIFDKNMNYQPVGIIGELYVGGDGLAKGYLNRDDLNRTSFIDHPHKPGEKLYKTGDYARWLADGNIEFRGRIDNQLKIRGFRVELGEIESVLSEIEGVIETVVKPIKIAEGNIKLAAFLNVSEEFNMSEKEINNCLIERLPAYMIPSAFKTLHGFPKTINGKINKDELTIDIDDIISRNEQDLNKLTENEKKILDIWCDVLKTKNILTTDNFFDVGGSSLLAISIMSKIESAFSIDLGLRVFFDSPKIRDLAEVIEIMKYIAATENNKKKNGKDKAHIIEGEIN